MKFDPEKHNRRSVRLKRYDYTDGNVYFVTICAYQKECLFGTIVDGRMNLNSAGECVKKAWLETAEKRTNIRLDDFIIMPNHFHGILRIARRGSTNYPPILVDPICLSHRGSTNYPPILVDPICLSHRGTACRAQETNNEIRILGTARCAPTHEQFGKPILGSLPTIIRSFKSATIKLINESRDTHGAPAWQRNYYEHIIHSHNELLQTIEYIRSNPGRWTHDEENPTNLEPNGQGVPYPRNCV